MIKRLIGTLVIVALTGIVVGILEVSGRSDAVLPVVIVGAVAALFWSTRGLLGVSCARCAKTWRKMEVPSIEPTELESMTVMLEHLTVERGFNCGKCGIILCECWLRAWKTCPRCRSHEFKTVWLRGYNDTE
jgi:hypothetical protein